MGGFALALKSGTLDKSAVDFDLKQQQLIGNRGQVS